VWFKCLGISSLSEITDEFFVLLCAAWEVKRSSFSIGDKEDVISRVLIGWMENWIRENDGRWQVASQAESFRNEEWSGRTDITIFCLSRKIVYECKRLNTSTPNGRASLAGKYVGEGGMGCFLTGQYSSEEELAGMIGYVMDGDMTFAFKQVIAKVQTETRPLQPIKFYSTSQADIKRFNTSHDRSCPLNPIQLDHIFLPV
jgi:hypothetical protein